MWPVEGSTEGLLRLKQFSLPKADEAHEVSGSDVDMMIASTNFTNMPFVSIMGT